MEAKVSRSLTVCFRPEGPAEVAEDSDDGVALDGRRSAKSLVRAAMGDRSEGERAATGDRSRSEAGAVPAGWLLEVDVLRASTWLCKNSSCRRNCEFSSRSFSSSRCIEG